MQIQKEESPVYNNIFIALGSFHMKMAYFRALSESSFISRFKSLSGGSFLLEEYQVSIKSFLSELSYNKCKPLHEILATTFEAVYFKTFLDLQEDKEEMLEIVSNQTKIK